MVRSVLREIKTSLGRYLAMVAIIGLGMGFLAGLMQTRPSMIRTWDSYAAQAAFFDWHLISTLGWEEEDCAAVRAESDTEKAEGTRETDALVLPGEGSESAVRICQISREVNVPRLTAGRLPENAAECLADAGWLGEEDLGSRIVLTDNNDEDTLDAFETREFTVVGLAGSPLYIGTDRGNTALGDGTLSGFILVPEEAFSWDYYTDIYLTLTEKAEVYSADYDSLIDRTKDPVTDAAEAAARARYERVVGEAQEKLDDARKELEDGRKEYEDGVKDYEDGVREYEDGVKEYEDGLKTYAEEKEDAEKELADAAEELRKGRIDWMEGVEEFYRGQLSFRTLLAVPDPRLLPQAAAVYAQLAEAKMQLKLGQRELADGEKELEDARAEADEKFADAWQELEDAAQELADGKADLEQAKIDLAEAEEELADAEKKLADAQQEVDDIEEPSVYVLDRETNVGHAGYKSDTDVLAGIARAFPLFFFLVAALVCITTMTRMVDEQRTQIGTLKALGYGEGTIMGKFLLYSGSAAVLGCIFGFVIGSLVMPRVIWRVYGSRYSLGELQLQISPVLGIGAGALYLLVSSLTTWSACRRELREVPASLLRPRAPKAGKRILLERIKPLWKRLPFLHKVSLRNIFRYKQRVFMMVIGIGGCTALLLTGFGIRDTVADIGVLQYRDVTPYDFSITYRDALTAEEEAFLAGQDWLETAEPAFSGNYKLVKGNTEKSVEVIAPAEAIPEGIWLLHDGEEALSWPEEGQALICRKLAQSLGVKKGEKITLLDEDRSPISLTVSGIFDNYIGKTVYVSQDSLKALPGGMPEIKTVYANCAAGTDLHAAAARLLERDAVINVSISADKEALISDTLSSMNYIVMLVILCSGVLAFIVLYNLTNININERLQEIATVKVLGFYSLESAWYVFRENLLLTILGAAAGLVLGYLLHGYVIGLLDLEELYFERRIIPLSYLLSVAFTFVFALIVNVVMFFRLERINMAEAMKAAE